MPDPEDKEIGAIIAGIIYLVGDYMQSESKRKSPGPGTADQEKTYDPEDDRQFVGMEKEEKLPIKMIIGRLEEFFHGKITAAKRVKILEKMIQIDKDSGEKTSRRSGERPGE